MGNHDIIKFDQNLVRRVGNTIALTNRLLALNKNEIKIFIANDHILFREGIKNLVKKNSNITVVGEACSFEEVYIKLKELSPDILLTDDQMPKTDIFNDIPNIKKLYPDLKIIMHTFGATESSIARYIQSINGYIEFSAAEEYYFEIFEKVYAGNNYFIKTEYENGKFIKCTTTEDREQFVALIENICSTYKTH